MEATLQYPKAIMRGLIMTYRTVKRKMISMRMILKVMRALIKLMNKPMNKPMTKTPTMKVTLMMMRKKTAMAQEGTSWLINTMHAPIMPMLHI